MLPICDELAEPATPALFKRTHYQTPGQHMQRQRDRVGRARTFQTVQEPQPALRIRQRDLCRTHQRTQRRTRCLRIPQPLPLRCLSNVVDGILKGRVFDRQVMLWPG